jgi:PAS domain S-box-containing protein
MAANLTVDREGKVTAWNAEAAELLGYSAAQAIGRVMDFFIPGEYHADHWAGFRHAVASGTLKFSPSDVLPVEMIHLNGTRMPIDVTIHPQRDGAGNITTLTAELKAAGPRGPKM